MRVPGPLVLSKADAARRLAALTGATPTYEGPGAFDGAPPPGYRLADERGEVGRGVRDLDTLGVGLRAWRVHEGAGLQVVGSHRADVGARVSSTVRLGPLTVAAPCVVTAVHDDEDVRGFSYVTLPGHPEQGEEAFVARLGRDGVVRLQVRAIWRPAGLLTTLALPLTIVLQKRATAAYVAAARRLLES
jgi:uncharacterized protein (UPF0548 family)